MSIAKWAIMVVHKCYIKIASQFMAQILGKFPQVFHEYWFYLQTYSFKFILNMIWTTENALKILFIDSFRSILTHFNFESFIGLDAQG